MVKKSFRASMQVDDVFHKKILELQNRMNKKIGKAESITEITKRIVQTPEFRDIEDKLLRDINESELDIRINFDRRRR